MADAQTSSTNPNNKNYWEKDASIESEPKIYAPTFTRVIVLRRILVNDMTNVTDNNNNVNNDGYIKVLMTEMKDLNDSMQSSVYNTLHLLMSNNGIKKYFSSWDEQDNNPSIIEIIFNKLILTRFVNEYQDVTSYKSKNTVNNNCSNKN